MSQVKELSVGDKVELRVYAPTDRLLEKFAPYNRHKYWYGKQGTVVGFWDRRNLEGCLLDYMVKVELDEDKGNPVSFRLSEVEKIPSSGELFEDML